MELSTSDAAYSRIYLKNMLIPVKLIAVFIYFLYISHGPCTLKKREETFNVKQVVFESWCLNKSFFS